MPLWRLPPLATMTLTSETPAPHYCAICALAVSRLLAMLHLRYGRLRSHLTLRAVYVCYLFLSSFWVLPGFLCCILSTGRRFHSYTLSMYIYVLFIFTLLYLSRERVVRNDSLIQRLGRQRSGGQCENNYPRSRHSCNRRVFRNLPRSRTSRTSCD